MHSGCGSVWMEGIRVVHALMPIPGTVVARACRQLRVTFTTPLFAYVVTEGALGTDELWLRSLLPFTSVRGGLWFWRTVTLGDGNLEQVSAQTLSRRVWMRLPLRAVSTLMPSRSLPLTCVQFSAV